MTNWQPIESAPKNNEYIICTWKKSWDNYKSNKSNCPMIAICYYNRIFGWISINEYYASKGPSHWMPIPEFEANEDD